jgi:RES domain-containing protein
VTKAWRIVKASRSRDAFSGEGARRYGGRWNHAGTAVVYLADSPALAALEQFVHLGRAHATLSFVAFPVHIPDELIAVFDPRRLPANWRELPAPPETKEIGTGWVVSASSAVLKIPSVLVPVEHNYVLNPAHPDFDRIEIGKPEPFSFDPRMWK